MHPIKGKQIFLPGLLSSQEIPHDPSSGESSLDDAASENTLREAAINTWKARLLSFFHFKGSFNQSCS